MKTKKTQGKSNNKTKPDTLKEEKPPKTLKVDQLTQKSRQPQSVVKKYIVGF